MNKTIDKAFSILSLLRVEENITPFTIKVKGTKGQVSVPLGTDVTPILGMGTLGRRGCFITIDFNV